MAATKKTEVFEILFDLVRDSESWEVDSDQVVAAIRERNQRHSAGDALSDKNPANFLKDFLRKKACNDNWPESLRAERITARQRYGGGRVLEFVRYREGDLEPFPNRYEPAADIRVIHIESLSIPRTARALGRKDEAWLIQVVVSQRVAHTHFAVVSEHELVDFNHLQMSVKTQPEIDAVFLATFKQGGEDVRALVTCEAKQFGERLLEDQIREQVKQAFSITDRLGSEATIDAVVPVAVTVIRHGAADGAARGIHFLEFGLVGREDFDRRYGGDDLYGMPLEVESEAVYMLHPKVRGVSSN